MKCIRKMASWSKAIDTDTATCTILLLAGWWLLRPVCGPETEFIFLRLQIYLDCTVLARLCCWPCRCSSAVNVAEHVKVLATSLRTRTSHPSRATHRRWFLPASTANHKVQLACVAPLSPPTWWAWTKLFVGLLFTQNPRSACLAATTAFPWCMVVA